LREPREAKTVLHDVADMRQRIAGEFPGTGVWSLKYVRGGLLDLEFIAQGLQLTTAADAPSILHRPTATVFEELAAQGHMERDVAEALAENTRLFQDVESLFRLCLEGAPSEENIPAGLVRALTRVANMPDLATLKAELGAREQHVLARYEELIGQHHNAGAT